MKKVLITVLTGVLAGMTFAPARAEDDAEKKFEFNGEVRARYEYLNNYLDLTDDQASGDINDDSFSIAPYRVMLGITGNFAKNVTAHVDLQYVGHAGDEFPSKNAFDSTPVDQGSIPYQFATQGEQFYQGWLEIGKIGGSDVGVRVGRQEHTYGTELFLGDNDYYAGLSFDGARGMWHHGSSDLNFFYYKISEENFCFSSDCVFNNLAGSIDTNLWGATYDWNFKTMGTVGGYVLILQDLGGDFTGTADSKVNTYGARWNRGMMNGDTLNMLDWDIEYAMQGGDFGEPAGGPNQKLKAWIGEGWFAYNFKAGDGHGRVHIGTLMTSGEKNSTADEEDFLGLFGDFHANNRFGDLDWVDSTTTLGLGGPHNITDYNIGYEHWLGNDHYFMFAYHMFQLTEANGAANDKIGDEIDLKYGYQYSKNLAFEVMIGQAQGDDAFFGFATDPVQRASVQAKLCW